MRERPDFSVLHIELAFPDKNIVHITNPENEGFALYDCSTYELEEFAAMLAGETPYPIVICLYGAVQDAETSKPYYLTGQAAVHGGMAYTYNVWTLPYNDIRVVPVADQDYTFSKARVFAELIPGSVDAWQKKHAGNYNPLFK